MTVACLTMASKKSAEKVNHIELIINEVNRSGRATAVSIAALLGVHCKTARKYLDRAAATGEVIRFGGCGLFRDAAAIADFNRERATRCYALRKQKRLASRQVQQTQNIIFQECRASEAMRRVLFVYGVHP